MGRLEANLRAKMAPRWIWEASWGGLGGFLGRLEAKLRAKMIPSWVPRGSFFGRPKTNRKWMHYWVTLGSTCSWILVRFWEGLGVPKIDKQNEQIVFGTVLERLGFLFDFGIDFGALW